MDFEQLLTLDNSISLVDIQEYDGNALRLHLCQNTISHHSKHLKIGDTDIIEYHPIEIDYSKPVIIIDFPEYVTYASVNESYDYKDKNTSFKGKWFRQYESSSFIEYAKTSTFAYGIYSSDLTH